MLVLVVGVLIPANRVNLGLSAEDTGEVIMPPGMIRGPDTPGAAMREMGAVDPDDIGYRAAVSVRGCQALDPTMDGDTKVFDLTVSVIQWLILDDELVAAFAFNQQVPGPLIRINQGDHVVLNVHNELPESTTVHWHGLDVPIEMDGPAFVTQDPIEPGDSNRYEFTVEQAGTFLCQSHDQPDRQQALGMYGALIVDPADDTIDESNDYDCDVPVLLQEWLEREGYTYPAMLMEGAMPNFFTINGKAYPNTETLHMRVGEKARFRFIGTNNNFIHHHAH